MNVLLIALAFPPIQSAGAFRGLRFATGLPSFGIKPVVVCFNPAQFADGRVHVLNLELADRLPADVPIFFIDVSAIEPGRSRLALEQAGKFRGVHCYTMLELFDRISRDYPIDVIWATAPPFNVGLLACAAKAHFGRPLVLDMRDAWSQWGSVPFRTWLHYRRIIGKERRLLNAANAVACVTPQLADMERNVSGDSRILFTWIPNAYEQDTLPTGVIELEPDCIPFRVGYAGQFYYNAMHEDEIGFIPWYRKLPHRWLHYHATRQRWIYRSPYFFFRAWRTLLDTRPILGQRVEFHYVGSLPDWLDDMAHKFGLADRCHWHGIKPKSETQAIMEDCAVLLLTSIKVIGGEDYCLASKTFDYIEARRPVLGFVCAGMQRDFLENAKIAEMFDPDDPVSSAAKLADIIERGVTFQIDSTYLERYSSKTTTRILADLLRGVVYQKQVGLS